MPGKRVNQFNLMLNDSEVDMLKIKSEKKGYVNKSNYLRELIKHDNSENDNQLLPATQLISAEAKQLAVQIKTVNTKCNVMFVINLLTLGALIAILLR